MSKIVLLIDDQAYSFNTLSERLGKYGIPLEKEIDATGGFRRALELYNEGKLGLILADIIMKTGNDIEDETGGREAGVIMAEKLRECGVDVPIVFWTVVTDEHIRKRAGRIKDSRYNGKIPSRKIAEIVKEIISL